MDLEDHASYIDSWRSLLRKDARAVVTAARKAPAAAQYVLERIGTIKPMDDEEEDEALAA